MGIRDLMRQLRPVACVAGLAAAAVGSFYLYNRLQKKDPEKDPEPAVVELRRSNGEDLYPKRENVTSEADTNSQCTGSDVDLPPEAECTGSDVDLPPEAECTGSDVDLSPAAECTGSDVDLSPVAECTVSEADLNPEAENTSEADLNSETESIVSEADLNSEAEFTNNETNLPPKTDSTVSEAGPPLEAGSTISEAGLNPECTVIEADVSPEAECTVSESDQLPEAECTVSEAVPPPEAECTVNESDQLTEAECTVSESDQLPEAECTFSKTDVNSNLIPEEESTVLEATLASTEECSISEAALTPEAECSVSEADQTPEGECSAKKADVKTKTKMSLEDFNCIAVIGCGNYGKVLLSEYRTTREMFAIKALQKVDVLAREYRHRLMCEKKVLETATKMRNPFLVNLFGSFQTKHYVCLVMEYMAGGDMTTHLQAGIFPEPRAVFSAACVVLGLQFLHDHNIVHRDLKPDNLLLDSQGYVKIADFGYCKQGMGMLDRTTSRVGTPEYVAPEVLKDSSYTRAVDWWSFGVVIYAMLVGETPFYAEDLQDIYYKISYGMLHLPNFLSRPAGMIILKLLWRNPDARLGSGIRGAEEVKEQRFFKSIDWDALRARTLKAPFVPTILHREDVSNFDAEYTSEDPVLPLPSDPRVLTEEEQALFADFDYTGD